VLSTMAKKKFTYHALDGNAALVDADQASE
jgi:hypothetical protein